MQAEALGGTHGLGWAGESKRHAFPGLRGVEMSIWWGLVAPAATPEPVLERLRQAALEMNTEPAFAARLRQLGFDTMPLDGDAFRSFVVEDLPRGRETAAAANIQID